MAVTSYWDLAKELTDTEAAIAWCRNRDLLATQHDCVCGTSCRVVKRARYSEKVAWRCPRKGCQKIVSLRDGSFFSNSSLPIIKILRIIHLWSTKTSLGDMQKEVDIANSTAVDWFNFMRDVCAQYFIDHPVQIGGPGIEVEIDESKFGRRKYHRGRMVDGHWIFGGTECITGNSFLVEVNKRDAQTLIPIIKDYIRADTHANSYIPALVGSIIYSDEWRAYSGIAAVPGMNYVHWTVNHSQNFVNPLTGSHTQGIESMWSQCKRMMRKTQTMHSQLFETYLPEFMWWKRFDGPHNNSFNNIIQHIAEQYPLS